MKNQITKFNLQSPISYLLSSILLAACGCSMVTYTSPSGERFMRSSIGANTSVSSLAVESDTNGVRRVEMHGYQNDASQALSAVTEAAVKAALQGVK
jgi:hypothetical protein